MKVILAGCLLLLSFNAFAQESTISFYGFGDVSAENLCIKKTANDTLVYIKSVFQEVVVESEGYLATNCAAIYNGMESTEEIESICAGSNETMEVGHQSIVVLEYSPEELDVAHNLSKCN